MTDSTAGALRGLALASLFLAWILSAPWRERRRARRNWIAAGKDPAVIDAAFRPGDWWRRGVWNAGLILFGLFGLAGIFSLLSVILDRTIRPEERLGTWGFGIVLLALFTVFLQVRAWWLRREGIYSSWVDLCAAVDASMNTFPVTQSDVELLRAFIAREFPSAPPPVEESAAPAAAAAPRFVEVYEKARARRGESAIAEQEFRRMAEMIYRVMAIQLRIHAYNAVDSSPRATSRGIIVSGVLFVLLGAWFVISAGPTSVAALLVAVLASALLVLVGIGLAAGWRWALGYALAALAAAEVTAIWRLAAGATGPFHTFAALVPLFLAVYLFRNRASFRRT